MMDLLQVIALIIVALLILAMIVAYQKRLVVALKFLGINLGVEAENEAGQKPGVAPAGVRARQIKSTEGGILIEAGIAHDASGTGIEVAEFEAKGDIIIGGGESGDPKGQPPA
jgi:hypothetical protein